MSKGWGGGSTWAWRRKRERVLKRDNYRCQLKIEGVCIGKATHVHHVKGKAMGDDERWLVAACAPCNLHVGDPTKHDPEPRQWTGW